MAENDLHEAMKEVLEKEIIKQVKSTPEYIEELVRAVILGDVNQWGNAYGTNNGRNEKRIPYFKYLVQERIKGICTLVVTSWLEQHLSTIEETIRERINETSVVDALAKAFAGSVDESWKIDVNFRRD